MAVETFDPQQALRELASVDGYMPKKAINMVILIMQENGSVVPIRRGCNPEQADRIMAHVFEHRTENENQRN